MQYRHISTGDRCRFEKESGTEVGKTLAEYEKKGDLVPDSIMKKLFSQILSENTSEKGIILDGYPRTKAQVDDLMALMKEHNLNIDKVLNIEVPEKELLKRAQKRAETSTREDDKKPETHLKRIKVFEKSTRPAIEYLKSKVSVETFDGLGSIKEVTEKVLSTFA